MSVKPVKPAQAGVKRDANGRVMPGSSLNPSGKPRDPATRKECQRHLYSRGREVVDKAVEYALGGDKKMLVFLLTRIVPEVAPLEVTEEPETTEEKGRAWTVAELRARAERVG